MEGDDILQVAQKRRVGRKPSSVRPPFPSDHMLRIDNYTIGGNSPSGSPTSHRVS